MLQCLQPIHEPLTAIIYTSRLNLYVHNVKVCGKLVVLKTKTTLFEMSKSMWSFNATVFRLSVLANRFQLMTQLYCDYQYTGIIKALIHQYKFMKDHYLAQVLAYQLKLPQIKYDYVVPIPSPKVRDDARTFNPVTTVLAYKGIQYINLYLRICVLSNQNYQNRAC